MARTRCRRQGFTLIELLVALAIIGILWGLGMNVAPRILADSGPEELARNLAVAGQEARQMAMLQQRPWELLLDLEEGVYYRAPLGAVRRREMRLRDAIVGDGADPAEQSGNDLASQKARQGALTEQDLIALRRRELNSQPADTLRIQRRYDSMAFHYDATDSDIFEASMPHGARVLQVWREGNIVETQGRVSLVFGPRGFITPTVIWLEDAGSGREIHTVYFSGIVPPVTARGMYLPDAWGELAPVDMP